jgi:hypothetical protein
VAGSAVTVSHIVSLDKSAGFIGSPKHVRGESIGIASPPHVDSAFTRPQVRFPKIDLTLFRASAILVSGFLNSKQGWHGAVAMKAVFRVVGVRKDTSRMMICQRLERPQADRVRQSLMNANAFESVLIEIDDASVPSLNLMADVTNAS